MALKEQPPNQDQQACYSAGVPRLLAQACGILVKGEGSTEDPLQRILPTTLQEGFIHTGSAFRKGMCALKSVSLYLVGCVGGLRSWNYYN